MTYAETIAYLYALLPVFHRIGAAAYKANLDNTLALCKYLGNPETKFPTVHIAGTNGKGSSSHLTASVLQAAGYKTGLYTSPHLKDFRERIRINGIEVPEQFVVDFVAKHRTFIEQLQPSFFELTVGMAFCYFAEQKVDIAVIEVGLGGRLDSTNVIEPLACLITSISYDHQNLLGDTLPQIATEKAGIIKPHTPVVVSQTQEEVKAVFESKAQEMAAPISFADKIYWLDFQHNRRENLDSFDIYKDNKAHIRRVTCELKGDYQPNNIKGVLALLDILPQFPVTQNHIRMGLSTVCRATGLKGRWQQIGTAPLMICDVGHNEDGIRQVVKQIKKQKFEQLHFVLGAVNDKAIDKMLVQLPKQAIYYFCKPNIPRGLAADLLQEQAKSYDLQGRCYESVQAAIMAARQQAKAQDFIFIGGSNFVVAEVEGL